MRKHLVFFCERVMQKGFPLPRSQVVKNTFCSNLQSCLAMSQKNFRLELSLAKNVLKDCHLKFGFRFRTFFLYKGHVYR